jgi:hypothetical protein
MAAATYAVQLIGVDRADWAGTLRAALYDELRSLGVHHSVALDVRDDAPATEPTVAVFLGSKAAATNVGAAAAVESALERLCVVLPVVEDLAHYPELVPPMLQRINGHQWTGVAGATQLARLVLEELGIEERQRRVFISHKREDGLLAAEQLSDQLSKHGFDPFIDRFDIRIGSDVQTTIADALEAHAFILLLETPLAHTSAWVYDEVDYALSHAMGLHIVTWPGEPPQVPGSARLRRQALTSADLTTIRGYSVLTDAALDRTVAQIEEAHAFALVRRRRNLLRSVEDAAESKGLSCTPLPGWRLRIESVTTKEIVAVSSRLPEVIDLCRLDAAREDSNSNPESGLLVHAARILKDDRRSLLSWATGDRPLTLLPENVIGGRW